jgi:hypothetical protein
MESTARFGDIRVSSRTPPAGYNLDNEASRADPARGPRRCPQAHGNPRKSVLERLAVTPDNREMLAWSKRLLVRLRSVRPDTQCNPQASVRPSPPSRGFLGERIYYLDSRSRAVEASCVDVATDWVPLFDVEVVDNGEVVESYTGIRGYTALNELVQSRGWVKRPQMQYHKDAAAHEGNAPPGVG